MLSPLSPATFALGATVEYFASCPFSELTTVDWRAFHACLDAHAYCIYADFARRTPWARMTEQQQLHQLESFSAAADRWLAICGAIHANREPAEHVENILAWCRERQAAMRTPTSDKSIIGN